MIKERFKIAYINSALIFAELSYAKDTDTNDGIAFLEKCKIKVAKVKKE